MIAAAIMRQAEQRIFRCDRFRRNGVQSGSGDLAAAQGFGKGGAGHKVAAGSVDDECTVLHEGAEQTGDEVGAVLFQYLAVCHDGAGQVGKVSLAEKGQRQLPQPLPPSCSNCTSPFSKAESCFYTVIRYLLLFYLRCILLLPGGSQIFQQRPAHHRACRLGKRQPHFLFQLPDSIGQAGLRNIELLHCMADGVGAGNSRDIAELLKGHGCFLSACFFYPTAEPPKTQRIFFFEIPNEYCRHIQDTFYPPCNFPYNSTAVLKQLQHSHITKEAFRYGTTAK